MAGPVLDCCWHEDGSKVFMASCDKQVKMWDLTNQATQVRNIGQSDSIADSQDGQLAFSGLYVS